MEIALRQGKYKTYLDKSKIKFKTIEISDGTITLSTPSVKIVLNKLSIQVLECFPN